MGKKLSFFILLCTIIFFAKCKCNKDVATPNDGLPPVTQTGANTLGFLLNGQPWIPAGSNGTPNLSWYYDPTYANGNLSISAYHINSTTDKQYFIIGGGAIKSVGVYPIGYNYTIGVQFSSLIDSCEIRSDSTTYCSGNLTITKFDTANSIISGTFYATLYNSSSHCGDTLKITDGRFDLGP